MRWIVLALVCVAAVVTVNVALLSFGWPRHDPVGRLSPVGATIPPAGPSPAPTTARGEDD